MRPSPARSPRHRSRRGPSTRSTATPALAFRTKGLNGTVSRDGQVDEQRSGPRCQPPDPAPKPDCGRASIEHMPFSFENKPWQTTLYEAFITQVGDRFKTCSKGDGRFGDEDGLIEAYAKIPHDVLKRRTVRLHGEATRSSTGALHEGRITTTLTWSLVLRRKGH